VLGIFGVRQKTEIVYFYAATIARLYIKVRFLIVFFLPLKGCWWKVKISLTNPTYVCINH